MARVFYNELAPYYHLIYSNWELGMNEQADAEPVDRQGMAEREHLIGH